MWIQYNKKPLIVNGVVMEIIYRGVEVKKSAGKFCRRF